METVTVQRKKVYIGTREMDGDRLQMVPTVRVGFQSPEDSCVLVDPQKLPVRADLVNHSPDGFEWGYGGSGPAQLSLGILADILGDAKALAYYQSFKWACVSKLPDCAWVLHEDKIMEILRGLEGWVEA